MLSSILESQDVSDFIAHGWLQSAKLNIAKGTMDPRVEFISQNLD